VVPPESVLRAFGCSGTPAAIAGGQGTTFRCGEVILKPAGRVDEAEWTADTFERLRGEGFRVAKPVRVAGGKAVVEGWTAWTRLDGEHAGRNGGRWPETVAVCEAFHLALEGVERPAFLDLRDDPWSEADRMAWSEAPPDVLPELHPLVERYLRLLRRVESPSQVVHGDFTANVLFADGLAPAVIDFSPYWRPAGFAVGVVLADAVTWGEAGAEVFDLGFHIEEFPQLLVRAAFRRLLEVDRHARRSPRDVRGELSRHVQTLELVEHFAAG